MTVLSSMNTPTCRVGRDGVERVLPLAAWLAAASLVAALVVGGARAQQRSVVLLALGAGQLGVALGARTSRHRAGNGTGEHDASSNYELPLSVAGAGLLLAAAVLVPRCMWRSPPRRCRPPRGG